MKYVYKINRDGIYSHIVKIKSSNCHDWELEKINTENYDVFSTYTRAKKELTRYFKGEIEEIKYALKTLSKTKLSDISEQ